MAEEYTTQKVNLTINRLSKEKYFELSSQGKISSDQVYVINPNSRINALGYRAINFAQPILSSDAANKAYVDTAISVCLNGLEDMLKNI